MTTQNSAKTPEELQGANAALGRKVAALEIEVRLLREMLALARLDRFGPKSEKTPHEQQAGLFNEVEATADVNVPEPETQTVTSYARRKTRGPCTIDLNTLPQEEIVHDLPEEEQVCPACARALHGMGEVVRREIKIIPARMVVVNHVRKKYTCRHCQDNALRTPVLTAPMPSPAFPGSMASASCVAFIIGQKFLDAMPLYRQEKQWARNGVLISRQTMANWVIKGADWLLPIYEKLHRHLLLCAIVKADETCVQVLHEDGRRAQAQSYMWVFRNGRDGPAIVFYCYRPTRAGENAAQCLAGFKGFLQTDGYAGYNLVAGVRHVGCWAHARRKFDEAISVLPAAERRKGGTLAHVGMDYCNELFRVERDLNDHTPEERFAGRLERSKPVLDEFRAWLTEQKPQVLHQSLVAKAITYALNQWDKLVAFLEDGRLDIDNNSSERAIKPFVIGRKNWMFANTPTGADASAVLYSIIETAKENGLRPTAYIEYLFERLPNVTTSALDDLLPWSPSLPASLRSPERHSV